MRKFILAGLAILAVVAGVVYLRMDKETRGIMAHLPTDRNVLFWSNDQRDAAFRAMDRLPALAKANDVAAGPNPSPLPAGTPLVLDGLDAYMAAQRTAALVIVQDGKVRVERYGLGFDAQGRWTSFSVAKSFTSTLVGAAIQDGAIKSLDDKVSTYIEGLKGSAYDDVTVQQLLTMSSGVAWNEDYGDPKSDVARFNDAKPDPGLDATVSYMRKLPRAHPPGTVWNYNTGETNLIGVLVMSATKKSLASYLSEKVWQPFGMEQKATWLLSATGQEIGGCCLQIAARDYARMGQFVLAGGRIGDTQVVPADWFAQATTKKFDIGEPGRGYGFQWWTYDDGAVSARGIFGQGIFIDPKRKLVIASLSNWSHATDDPSEARREAFYRQVVAALDAEQAAKGAATK